MSMFFKNNVPQTFEHEVSTPFKNSFGSLPVLEIY